MATAPDQTNERAKEATKRRWYGKQEWRATLLYGPTSPNRDQPHQPPILPYRTWRTKSHPRISMVCRRATKNRLETWMDRLRTTPSNISGQQREKGQLRTPTKEHPSREEGGSLLPRKDHLPSETNPCSACRGHPL